jgi:hypothetical protein
LQPLTVGILPRNGDKNIGEPYSNQGPEQVTHMKLARLRFMQAWKFNITNEFSTRQCTTSLDSIQAQIEEVGVRHGGTPIRTLCLEDKFRRLSCGFSLALLTSCTAVSYGVRQLLAQVGPHLTRFQQ